MPKRSDVTRQEYHRICTAVLTYTQTKDSLENVQDSSNPLILQNNTQMT